MEWTHLSSCQRVVANLCVSSCLLSSTVAKLEVTTVITPLLSLLQDQVDHLTARGIVAKAFSGDTDRRERDDILQSFKLRNPEHHVQLLYVTPEMINKSTAFNNGLMTLWRNKKLARLVIDEADCVSQWGHDFRPDYKMLGEVRRNRSAAAGHQAGCG
jgi:bloom syndrome protein